MGLFVGAAGRGESRDAFPTPPILPNSQVGTSSIRRVNLSRAESALQKVAVYAAVNLICSIASSLPVQVFSGVGVDRRPRPAPPWMADLSADGHGTADWIWQALYSAALRGNVVGEALARNPQTGQPNTIVLAHPDDVDVSQSATSGKVEWRIGGKVVPAERVWHRRLYPVPGRVLGLSPIALHATTISEGLYAQNFGAQWFLDGGHPSAILTNDQAREIDQPTARAVKERFLAAVRGTREPVVLAGGWKYQQIQIAPGESQFLETQMATAAECARIFGPGMPELLGYETGGSMTYANIEQRSVDLLKYTLDPWFTRIERWLSELLPQPQYVRLDRRALLRTDALTRFQKHQIALKNGLEFINEIRTNEEDLAPVPWGDEPYLPALGPAAAAAAVNSEPGAVPTNDPATPSPEGGQ